MSALERGFSKGSLPVSSSPNTFSGSWAVSEELLAAARRAKSTRDFFFLLVEGITGGRLGPKELKRLEHKPFIDAIVRDNGLEPFFNPDAGSLYTALFKAFERKEREAVEREWEAVLENWRSELEAQLDRCVSLYREASGPRLEVAFELYRREELLLPLWVLEELPSPDEFWPWALEKFSPSAVEEELLRWEALPAYRRRSKILKQVAGAFASGWLELAIYALFPLAEGAVWDTLVRFNPLEKRLEELIRKRNRKFVTIQYALKLLLQRLLSISDIPSFLDWHPFIDYREGTLNRHAIQHGVAVEFGTRENFLKLLLFNGFLADVLVGVEHNPET